MMKIIIYLLVFFCGLLITPTSAISGLPLYVRACDGTNPYQNWTISGTSVYAYNKQCLDIPDCDTAPGDAELQVFPCGSTLCAGKNQMWTAQSNGALQTSLDGLCLDLNVANGKVQTWTCSGANNQNWIRDGGSLKNGQTGQCLTVAVGDPYTNPVYNRDYPDPTVIRGNDGQYYAYSTQSAGCHICASRSANLVSWGDTTDALPSGNSWASSNFWAPDVSFHNGTYFMFYAAQQNGGTNMCIGIALSQQPLGPFKDMGHPLFCGNSFTTIDPKMFDAANGKIYLYWGSDFGPIWARELDSSRMSFAAGSQPISLITPSSAPYEGLIEGAWMTYNPKQSSYYFLFYSGDNCCAPNPHYAVMVARSLSPTGPFTKMGYPVLELGGPFVATGHNSVLHDVAGQDWMFYHAFNDGQLTQRKLMMDHIVYLNDWPTIGGVPGQSGTPSTSGIGPVYK